MRHGLIPSLQGLKAPARRRQPRFLIQQIVAAALGDADRFHGARRVDCEAQHDSPLDAALAGQRWITRLRGSSRQEAQASRSRRRSRRLDGRARRHGTAGIAVGRFSAGGLSLSASSSERTEWACRGLLSLPRRTEALKASAWLILGSFRRDRRPFRLLDRLLRGRA